MLQSKQNADKNVGQIQWERNRETKKKQYCEYCGPNRQVKHTHKHIYTHSYQCVCVCANQVQKETIIIIIINWPVARLISFVYSLHYCALHNLSCQSRFQGEREGKRERANLKALHRSLLTASAYAIFASIK